VRKRDGDTNRVMKSIDGTIAMTELIGLCAVILVDLNHVGLHQKSSKRAYACDGRGEQWGHRREKKKNAHSQREHGDHNAKENTTSQARRSSLTSEECVQRTEHPANTPYRVGFGFVDMNGLRDGHPKRGHSPLAVLMCCHS
jgi:hypothetical protein